MSSKIYVIGLALVAAVGGLLFGFDTAVISGTTEALQAYFQISDLELGWVVSSALVGCILGVVVAGWFADRFGRKAGLVFSGILFAIASVATAFAGSVPFLIAARLIGGIGVGIASMICPMYIAEISPPKIRGALVSLNQIAIVSGMVLAYLSNRSIVGFGDEQWILQSGWRWMFGMMLVPSVLFLMLCTLIPESPRWLAKRGFLATAKTIIGRIVPPGTADTAMESILQSLAEEEGKMRELFRPGARRITVMTMVLALFQAFTGINIVMYYAPRIFLNAGLAAGDAYGHSIIIGLVMIFFTVISLLIVDRLGRRPVMLAASAGMGLSLLLMGLAFPEAEKQGMVLLLCTLSYVSWFSVGMGGIYWIVVSEIFPNRVRGRAMALSVVFLWGGNFLVAQFFPMMLSLFQGASFFVFAAACLACLIFVAKYLPETKGRSLEDLEKDFFLHPGHQEKFPAPAP